jgi:hypothetical protein
MVHSPMQELHQGVAAVPGATLAMHGPNWSGEEPVKCCQASWWKCMAGSAPRDLEDVLGVFGSSPLGFDEGAMPAHGMCHEGQLLKAVEQRLDEG